MIKGTFTSVWSNGALTTPAELYIDNHSVIAESVDVGDDFENLIREYFTDDKGNEYEICPVCHSFLMSTVQERLDNGIYVAVDRCTDPECEYNN